MHPNAFIQRLWRGAETETVFVAMSFAQAYQERFDLIFRPAIESLRSKGKPLAPVRVDDSRSGDSIITDVVRGICESRLVLADVSDISTVGAPQPIRNANVMYELGLAHAAKSPAKVVIVRDDSRPLLFDCIPSPTTRSTSLIAKKRA